MVKNVLASFYRQFLRQALFNSGSFFINRIILPFYQGYLFGKRQLAKIYHPSDSRFWDIVTHRYLVHFIIIILGVLVLANNIQAKIVGFRDEDFGKETILYSLVGGDELGLIEEKADDTFIDQPTDNFNYQSGGIEAGSSFGEGEGEFNDLSATTQGGLALLKPEISPVQETSRVSRTKEEIYVVQNGDTVASLAEKFGVSVYTILWENNLTEKSYIRPGDKLIILPVSGIKHKVKRGETLDQIAQKYNVDKEKIIAYNDLVQNQGIKIGDDLLIPGGKKLPTYSPARVPASYVGGNTTTRPSSAVVSGTKLQWPTSASRITQYYGWRHTGLDIADKGSPPIYAAESGKVIRAQASGYNGGYGKNIIIDHGNGLQTLYGHLSKLYVTVGEQVSRGQTIGVMGTTGRSTGIHLHFEVRIGGSRVNPLSYIR
ncbi:MAG: M23 family metallopeptidase [Patescibacteria group bacterium]